MRKVTMKKSSVVVLCFLILAICIGTVFIKSCNNDNQSKIIKVHDTLKVKVPIEKVIKSPPIYITGRAHIVYVHDTVVKCTPFVASLDTIANNGRDTIAITYQHPEATFTLNVARRDSILKEIIEVEVPRDRNVIIQENIPWWERPAYTGAGIILGTIIGLIVK